MYLSYIKSLTVRTKYINITYKVGSPHKFRLVISSFGLFTSKYKLQTCRNCYSTCKVNNDTGNLSHKPPGNLLAARRGSTCTTQGESSRAVSPTVTSAATAVWPQTASTQMSQRSPRGTKSLSEFPGRPSGTPTAVNSSCPRLLC